MGLSTHTHHCIKILVVCMCVRYGSGMFEGLVTCTYCTLYCVCMITAVLRLTSSITRDTESDLRWGWLGLGKRLDHKRSAIGEQQLQRTELLVIHYPPASCLLSSVDNSWCLVSCFLVCDHETNRLVRETNHLVRETNHLVCETNLAIWYMRLTIWYVRLT